MLNSTFYHILKLQKLFENENKGIYLASLELFA